MKSKDEVHMRYYHYLRATLAGKKRKEKRLTYELKKVWDEIDKIKSELENPWEKREREKGEKENV